MKSPPCIPDVYSLLQDFQMLACHHCLPLPGGVATPVSVKLGSPSSVCHALLRNIHSGVVLLHNTLLVYNSSSRCLWATATTSDTKRKIERNAQTFVYFHMRALQCM